MDESEGYPRICIVTPSYNQGRYLEECIVSVLDQNYPNLEYVIMDGDSTDDSVEIIKKYEKYLTYWQSKSDGGQYAAINEGFKRTTGGVMSWLNSDDFFHPEAFSRVAAIFTQRPDAAWITGKPNRVQNNEDCVFEMPTLPLWSRERYLKKKYRNPFIQQEGTFWRRSLWAAAGSYLRTDLKLAGDLELWVRFFRIARLVSVDALIAGYRQHSNQKAQLFMREYIQEAEEILDQENMRMSREKDIRLMPAPIPISKYELSEYTRLYQSGKTVSTAKNNVRQIAKIDLNPSNKNIDDPSQKIFVSAIVSTFNSEKYIDGCLQDLLNQTLYKKGQLEIIVVDSHSEENEQRIVREFQKKYDNIRYIRTGRRESIYQAWNRGIKLADGKYITNANTDDRHRKDAFERMVNLLEMRPDIALVYADLLKTETPNETFENCTAVGRFTWYDWDRSKLLNEGCFMGPQPMWRRSVHDFYGYFDDECVTSGDYEFWLRISQTLNFHHIREPLGLYLIRPDSIEHREANRKQAEDKKINSLYREAERKGEIIRLRQNIDNEHDSSQLNTLTKSQKNTGDYAMESYEKFYQSIQPLLVGGNPHNVIAALCNLVNSFPDFAQAHNDLGVLYYQAGEKEKALNHYERAVQVEPDNVTFKKNLADFYYVEQGRVEDALQIYVNLLERNPQDVEILLITGHICVSLQQIEDARVFYNRVLEIEPWNADARNNLDQLEKLTPELVEDKSPEERYAQIKPLLEGEDLKPAIDALEKFSAAAPDFALAHNDLGVLYYRGGQKEKALAHYEQAVQIEPGNVVFQKNLADFYFAEQGRVEDALKIYVDVLAAYPEDIETLMITAHICVALHNFDDARVFYNRILEIEPWNADARQNLDKLNGFREEIRTASPGGKNGLFTVGG